ncbi:MAG: DUF4918 family protein [Chloroherpetonaceae bacterium]|nr:DUF4918 family protein [Chloroherpetonaceae bacterium]MCS7210270.1 DUF4918 family protein [Chloroherpetonaceae bacterium]MDW8019804.1 DUF4918 family protein [Chloroherpetonaceae bacterium]MDW8464639.1 DUF4918 family protein [Chloroherpetonaceae bacterium]
MTFAERAIQFFSTLEFALPLPEGVSAMNPYKNPEVMQVVSTFFQKFFGDEERRVFAFGINPGRFGGGLTGIAFTDPIALQKYLGIHSSLKGQREPSSVFIYDFIESMGGVEAFYAKFYFTSLSPIGFVKDGKNFNFYDNPDFAEALKPFIRESITRQIEFGAITKVAICLGTGEIYKFFKALNHTERFFEDILPVEHPRFIVQYKRSRIEHYLKKYQEAFEAALKMSES